MDSRLDISPVALAVVFKVPAWARPRGDIQRDLYAAFLAGAALISLDNLVRGEPAWAGVWRHRLALKAAAAATRLLPEGGGERVA